MKTVLERLDNFLEVPEILFEAQALNAYFMQLGSDLRRRILARFRVGPNSTITQIEKRQATLAPYSKMLCLYVDSSDKLIGIALGASDVVTIKKNSGSIDANSEMGKALKSVSNLNPEQFTRRWSSDDGANVPIGTTVVFEYHGKFAILKYLGEVRKEFLGTVIESGKKYQVLYDSSGKLAKGASVTWDEVKEAVGRYPDIYLFNKSAAGVDAAWNSGERRNSLINRADKIFAVSEDTEANKARDFRMRNRPMATADVASNMKRDLIAAVKDKSSLVPEMTKRCERAREIIIGKMEKVFQDSINSIRASNDKYTWKSLDSKVLQSYWSHLNEIFLYLGWLAKENNMENIKSHQKELERYLSAYGV